MTFTPEQIGHLLRTQDNRITADPLFAIEEKERIYGVTSDYTNDAEWVDDENEEVGKSKAARLGAVRIVGGEVPVSSVRPSPSCAQPSRPSGWWRW